MTIILLVLNLITNSIYQIQTTDSGKCQYQNSTEFVIMDEENM